MEDSRRREAFFLFAVVAASNTSPGSSRDGAVVPSHEQESSQRWVPEKTRRIAEDENEREKGRYTRIINSIHGGNGGMSDTNTFKPQGSLWNQILNSFECFNNINLNPKSLIKIKLGNGLNTLFWLDRWNGDQTLAAQFPRSFALESNKQATVSERIHENIEDWERRRRPRGGREAEELENLKSVIQQVQIHNKEDAWHIPSAPNERFSTRWFRQLIMERGASQFHTNNRWQKWAPKKINIFLWRLIRGRLPVRGVLKQFGTTMQSTLCPAQFVWMRLALWWKISLQDFQHMEDVWIWIDNIPMLSNHRKIFWITVMAAFKTIWDARNEKTFNNKERSKEIIFTTAQNLAFNWRDAGSILPDCKFEKDINQLVGISANGWFVYPVLLVYPVVICPNTLLSGGGGDSAAHATSSGRQLLNNLSTFTNVQDDPLVLSDSDEDQNPIPNDNQGVSDEDHTNDDMDENEIDGVENQVQDPPKDNQGESDKDHTNDAREQNEINGVDNQVQEPMPNKNKGVNEPSKLITRWTKNMITLNSVRSSRSPVTPAPVHDQESSSGKKRKKYRNPNVHLSAGKTRSSQRIKRTIESIHASTVRETRSSKRKLNERYGSDVQSSKKRRSGKKHVATQSVQIKRRIAKKKIGSAKRMSKKKDAPPPTLNVRTSPKTMYAVLKTLNEEQKESVREMGFAAILDMKLSCNLSRLGHYIVEVLDDQALVIRSGKGDISLTEEVVKDMLGVPDGEHDIETIEPLVATDPIVNAWRKQFPSSCITKAQLVAKIKESNNGGSIFKLNFITLFVNCICKSYKTGFCMTNIVNKIGGDIDISTLNWCDFILKCVKNSKKSWIPNSSKRSYAGPIIFLLLTYLHYVRGPDDAFGRAIPAISHWRYDMVKDREDSELRYGGFGIFEEPEAPGSEDDGVVPDNQLPHVSYQEQVYDMKQKLARITRYKHELMMIFTNSFEDGLEKLEMVDLKREFDHLFGINEDDTFEDEDVADIGEPPEIITFSCEATKPEEEVQDTEKDHPTTPLSSGKNDSQNAISSTKHPLDSPMSPYVLQLITEMESNAIRESEQRHRRSKFESIQKIKQPNFELGPEFQSPHKDKNDQPIHIAGVSNASHMADKPQPDYDDFLDDIPLSKRFRRPSAYKCSPYYNKQVEALDLIKVIEVKVSQYLFSFRGDPNYPVWELPDGSCISRIVLESLMPDTWIAIDAINAWTIVLNYEEFVKAKDLPTMVYLSVYKVVFCPLLCHDQYYLMVFDLKKVQVIILDNRKGMVLENYGVLPSLVVRYIYSFFKYLLLMLTYYYNFINLNRGGPLGKYDCGLMRESEEQSKLMWKMRKKYATKIIMCRLNKHINIFLSESNEFGKIPAHERKAILLNAYHQREERMKLL
ncbi:hypothetical protein LXL04_028304 [Taraxacum kok-saghyz]